MISNQNTHLNFGHKIIFNNISLHIKNSDRIGLIGNNGSGKTSFLNILANKIQPSSGYINYKVAPEKILIFREDDYSADRFCFKRAFLPVRARI